MQWSPVKLAGNKRTLDAVGETEDTSSESEDEREDGEMSEEEEMEGSDDECDPNPEGKSDKTNAPELEAIMSEPDAPVEQSEGRPREQNLSRHERVVEHTCNAGNNDLMVSHFAPPPQGHDQPQLSTQQRGDKQNGGGSQCGAGQPPSKGEHP